MFRCFLFLTLLLKLATGALASDVAAPRPASNDDRLLLQQIMQAVAADVNHWAYTETRVVRDDKGKIREQAVVRFDPSQPYEKQWTAISLNGAPPKPRDVERYRKRGDQARKRDENPASDKRQTLGEVIDLSRATLVEESGNRAVFDIALRTEGNNRFPPEKFQVLATVDRERKALTHIAVKLREPFRAKVVIKIKAGEASLDFETVTPGFAPTLTHVTGEASASLLFVTIGGLMDVKRSDFKRVKPYAERFDVQIGPIKALDF